MHRRNRVVPLLLLAGSSMVSPRAQAADESAPPLRQIQTIALPNVQGRIDHFAADVAGGRIFLSALGNNTAEVIDVTVGRVLHTITGLKHPQGCGYLPHLNRLVIANDIDGSCRIFDANTFRRIHLLDLRDDADDVRYDSNPSKVWVGYGSGGLALINVSSAKIEKDIPLEGHPEGFSISRKQQRIFVNVPTSQEVAVVDLRLGKVTAHWKLKENANFPMALDELNGRLLVVCRDPAKLLVLDSGSGDVVASLDCVGDADDIWLDPQTHRSYISGGEGFVSVIDQVDADHYRETARVPTAPGARTSLYVPQWHKLFVAVPHHSQQWAHVRVFETINPQPQGGQ